MLPCWPWGRGGRGLELELQHPEASPEVSPDFLPELLIRVLARIFCSCCFTAAKSPRHCQPEMVALFLLNVLGHISHTLNLNP